MQHPATSGWSVPLLVFLSSTALATGLMHLLHGVHAAAELLPGAAVGVLAGWLAWSNRRLARAQQNLEHELAQRTAQIVESKARLEATFANIPDMVWLKDANGRYLDCNRPFERLYGVSRKQLLGKTDHDFTDAALADSFRLHDARAIAAGRACTNEEWVTYADATEPVLLETVKTPLLGADGQLIGVLGIARDITQHRRDQARLRESETRLSMALESTQIGIWDWDVAHDTWYASATYYTMLGYSAENGPGDRHVWLERVHPDDRHITAPQIAAVLSGDARSYQYDARVRHAEGHYRWCSVRGRVISADADGRPLRMIGVRYDIDDLKAAQERIDRLAHFDILTGLPNRAMLNTRIGHAIEAARRSQGSLALIFLDLDRFKNVNDTLGHQVGDALLVETAQRMRALLRDEDIVSRQGGDEFIVMLPGCDALAAAHVAEKMLVGISRPFQVDGHELVVTPSMGIALYPDDAHDFDTLYKYADVAMYRAKRDGRIGYRFFTAEMQRRSARMLRIENALRRALERNELWLAYQPQVDLTDGRIVGVEALLRWQHPELGMIPPEEFVRIAEDSGQILHIGEWVMRTAARQMKHWHDSGLPDMVIAVNLSAMQFRHPDLLECVGAVLDDTGLPADKLELELTEGVAMDDPEGAMRLMTALHQRGVRLSIDDFGTGYSSLNYLKRFKVHKLKIDQSFVRNITQDPEDRGIVAAIVQLAGNLGVKTIAEGVETEAQLAYLREQGCHEVQGYLFGRPLAPEQFEAWARPRLAAPA